VNPRRAVDAVLGRFPRRTLLHRVGADLVWAQGPSWFARGAALDANPGSAAPAVRGDREAVVHVPEIRIARVDLPGVRLRDARRIAERRCADLRGDPPAVHVSSLVRRTRAGSVLWLVSAPNDVCLELDAELRQRGIEADRVLPLSLALGALARLLPAAEGGGLTALLWLEQEWSHCVIADSEGWLFDRQIPLKLGFDAAIGATPANAVAWEEEEHQFIEHVVVELGRTFNYVERNLSLGRVANVCLCGPLAGLEPVEHALVANQMLPILRLGARPLPSLGWAPHPASGAALGGIALGGSVAEATLVPDAALVPRLKARARRSLLRAAVAACALLALGLAAAAAYVSGISTSIERLRAQASRWEGERAALAQLAGERERARRVLDAHAAISQPQPPWSALLTALGGSMPERLFVAKLAIAREPEGWRMEIWLDSEGLDEAATADAVARLGNRLSALPLFSVIPSERQAAHEPAADSRQRIVTWVAPAERSGADGE